MGLGRRESRLAALFLLPAVLALLVFQYYPIAQTLIYSAFALDHTTDWLHAPFVGMANYAAVLASTQFWLSFRFTLYFTVASVFLEFWIGLALALVSFSVSPWLRGPLRAVLIVPWAVPAVIQASIWRWLFNTDVGLIGDLTVRLGLAATPPLFLADPRLAAPAVILAYLWKATSITAVFLMGGLAMVPPSLHDAAKMDGARAWRRLWTITLPVMAPTILVTLLFRTIDALRVFDLVYGLTGGGPGSTTDTLSTFAYRFYFKFVRFGEGSAYAVITFLIVFGLSWAYIRRIYPHLRFRQ